MTTTFSDAQLADFHRDGFVIVPSLLSAEEVGVLADHERCDGSTGPIGVVEHAGR